MNSGVLSWKRTGGLDVRQVAARTGDRHFLANFRGHKEWRGCRESRELDRDAGPARDGCVGRRRVHDKSNGAERGGVHGNDVTRVPAPRDLAEHWIGGDERRVSVDRRPPAVLATEAPVERVVVNVIEERKFFRYQPCARLYHLYY